MVDRSQLDSQYKLSFPAREELTNVLNINGGELLDMMSTSLKDDHLISFSCNDDCIEFETFNPLDGTGDYIKITIERVDENVS